MRTLFLFILFFPILSIIKCHGQSLMIDSIESEYEAMNFDQVIRIIKNELKSDSISKNKVYFYYRLADSYRLKRNLDSAMYFSNIAINLNDKDVRIHDVRATILYEKGKYEESLDSIHKAILINSESPFYFYLRAMIYKNLKKKKLAKLDFRKVMKLALQMNDQALYKSAEKTLNELK